MNSTNCQSCTVSGVYEAFLLADNSSCLSVCPDGFYENTTDHSCYACDEKCEICSQNSTFCQVCNSTVGPTESFWFSANSSCLLACPDGFYEDYVDHKCYACDNKCSLCDVNSTFCQECTPSGTF